VPAAVAAGVVTFCVAGVVLSVVTGEQGWATVSMTATGVVLATFVLDRLTERGRRVLDVLAVALAAVVLVGVVVLLAVTDGFADAWYLVVLAAVLLAGFVVGVRVRRRREADDPPRVAVARGARAGQDGPHD
jgi:general stress protein CsbA